MAESKIIIIDDEPDVRETLKEFFHLYGYEVAAFETGHSALENIRKSTFDIAIIDIGLPDINGLDLLKKIKEVSPGMICIIITGEGSLDSSIDAIHKGADGYFTKPL